MEWVDRLGGERSMTEVLEWERLQRPMLSATELDV
jgi:hypothetical protein